MKSQIAKAMIMVHISVLVSLSGVAWSQQIPGEARPGAVEKSLQAAPPPRPATLPEIPVDEDERGVLKGGEGVKFTLKDVTFADNWIFSSDQLKDLVKEYLGKTIEVSDLAKLTALITDFYKKNGYFLSRAYIPPQRIKDGVVQIGLREGRLGEIIIKGNKRYSRDLIRNTLKIIRGEGAVRTADVERGLLLLMDCPGLLVKATFKPGDRPGTSDIVLDVTEEASVKIGLDYNNYGSRFVSRDRIGLNLGFYNPAGYGDALSLRGVLGSTGSDKLYYLRGEYTIPVGHSGSKIGVSAHRMRYELAGELAHLDGRGNSEGFGLFYGYPLIRSRGVNWNVELGFDYKDVSQDILNQQVGKDFIRSGRLGTTVNWYDLHRGVNTVTLAGVTGFASVLGGMRQDYTDTIRQKTDVVYSKLEGQATRIQGLPYRFSLLFDAKGQWTTDRVPSSEQYSIGGAGTVRGYSSGEYSGDSGVSATAELRIPFPHFGTKGPGKKVGLGDIVQLAAFCDYGSVSINDHLPGEQSLKHINIAGAGVGIRIAFLPYVQLKADWATWIAGEKPRDENVYKGGTVHFQAALAIPF